MPRYEIVNSRQSIAARLHLSPIVDDAELFRIIGDAVDVVEMINLSIEQAIEDGETNAHVGVDSPIDHAVKALFAREPDKPGHQAAAGDA